MIRGVAERLLLATAPSTRLADNDRSLWHARPTKATMVPAQPSGTVARPYSPASFSHTWRLSAAPQEPPPPQQQRQHRRPHVMRKAPPMAHYRCAALHRQPPMLAGMLAGPKSVPVGNGVGNGVHVGAIPYSCRAPDGAGQGQEHELGMKRGSLRAPITASLRVPGTHHAASQIQLTAWGSPSQQQPKGGDVAPPPPQLAAAAASLRPASSAGSISIPSAARKASRSENAFARAVSRSHSQPGIFRAGGGWRPAPKGLLVVHVG